MYWDTYCVLLTLKIIDLVFFKAPQCKSKCELPPQFLDLMDFHACLTCTWNMFLLQKGSLFAYVLDSRMHFCSFFWKEKLHILQIRCGDKNSLCTTEMSVDWDEINSKLPFARTKVLLHLLISSSLSSMQCCYFASEKSHTQIIIIRTTLPWRFIGC